MRISKQDYYIKIAETVLERGTCLRRNYGAVIVKNDRIIGTGYTGAARGEPNCCDLGICERQRLNIPSGQRYELCCSVHAEANAVINAQCDVSGATLYLAGKDMATGEYIDGAPCMMCSRLIKNAGISKVINRKGVIL